MPSFPNVPVRIGPPWDGKGPPILVAHFSGKINVGLVTVQFIYVPRPAVVNIVEHTDPPSMQNYLGLWRDKTVKPSGPCSENPTILFDLKTIPDIPAGYDVHLTIPNSLNHEVYRWVHPNGPWQMLTHAAGSTWTTDSPLDCIFCIA